MTLICHTLVLMNYIKEIRDFYKCIVFCVILRSEKKWQVDNKFESVWV